MRCAARFLLLLFILPVLFCAADDEEAHEKLVISSLRNDDILTSFNFTVSASAKSGEESSFYYVPWLFRRLFEEHDLESLRISLTQGFWRPHVWGNHRLVDVPSGAFLLVKFGNNHTESIDARWSNLLHQLNGIFCTAILEMNPALTTTPKLFVHDLEEGDGNWRYGAVVSESVCSENLKTWKKLLPCKQNGLISLLEPRNLLSSNFHSISIFISRNSNNWLFHLAANTVHHERKREKRYWSLQNLFAKKLTTKCNIMSSSAIFVENVPQWTVERNADGEAVLNRKVYHFFNLLLWDGVEDFGLAATISGFKRLGNGEDHRANDDSVMSVHNFFKSSSQVGGQITTKITNPFSVAMPAIFSQMLPWQIRVNLHTLQISCKTLRDLIELGEILPQKRVFRLAKDMKNPLLIELLLDLPSKSICEITADYETAFLKITSFPADAHSGVYVPGPIVTFFPNAKSSHTDGNDYDDDGEWRLHGEPLLILLPVPDFSMPFNVICLVCTSIAIFYGNVITMTTKLMKPILKKTDGKDSPVSSKLRQKFSGILASLRNLWKKGNPSKTKDD